MKNYITFSEELTTECEALLLNKTLEKKGGVLYIDGAPVTESVKDYQQGGDTALATVDVIFYDTLREKGVITGVFATMNTFVGEHEHVHTASISVYFDNLYVANIILALHTSMNKPVYTAVEICGKEIRLNKNGVKFVDKK